MLAKKKNLSPIFLFFLCVVLVSPRSHFTPPAKKKKWEGKDAILTGRKILGETDPLKSLPGSIRGDFCIDVGRNIIHGSDSPEAAKHEVGSVRVQCVLKTGN